MNFSDGRGTANGLDVLAETPEDAREIADYGYRVAAAGLVGMPAPSRPAPMELFSGEVTPMDELPELPEQQPAAKDVVEHRAEDPGRVMLGQRPSWGQDRASGSSRPASESSWNPSTA